jgi:hypothetical protein
MINFFKKNLFPILIVIGGIVDQTTDLLVQLISELNAPSWVATFFRILVISFGAFRLYYSQSPNANRQGLGGTNPPPEKDEK